MSIAAVAVFCGSKSGSNEHYKRDAETLGILLAKHGIQMIYGGGQAGLMGQVAEAVLKRGGSVRGIMPERLMDKEIGHHALSELTIVDGMHERKRLMYGLCDAAIVLPGGYGTLDELFEILTWNGLALHDKKVFLLNSGGFYNHLLQHLRHIGKEGFLYEALEKSLTILNTAEEFANYIS